MSKFSACQDYKETVKKCQQSLIVAFLCQTLQRLVQEGNKQGLRNENKIGGTIKRAMDCRCWLKKYASKAIHAGNRMPTCSLCREGCSLSTLYISPWKKIDNNWTFLKTKAIVWEIQGGSWCMHISQHWTKMRNGGNPFVAKVTHAAW